MTTADDRVPASLVAASMQPVWQVVRSRLDRFGPDHRSRVRLGAPSTEAARVLRSLLGRSAATVPLVDLEASLVALGIGPDLDRALTALGHPPSASAAERRAARARAVEVRHQIDDALRGWAEPWARQWGLDAASGGVLAKLEPHEIAPIVGDVRRLLDFVDEGGVAGGALPPLIRDPGDRWSRVDLAARLYGSAHALDSGTLLERLCRRALAYRLGGDGPGSAADESAVVEHEVWEGSGIHLDRVSSPILTWGLDFDDNHPLAELARSSTGAGIPLALTTAALERWPVAACRHAGPILVVENPRVVEAAADASVGFAVVTTKGNPRRNAMTFVGDLIDAGNEVWYHGDFDSAGLTICSRMVDRGCRPLAMTDVDYHAACDQAATAGIELPVDDREAGPTPWCRPLCHAFNNERVRRVVHEELVLPALLAFTGRSAPHRRVR